MAPAATSKSIFLVVEDEGLVRKNAVDMIEEAGFGCAVLDADQQARSVRNVSFKIRNALRFGEITRLNPVQLVLFASLPFITIADSVPKFDIARECRSEGGSKAVLEKCIEDESAARDQLQPLWIQSSAADKASCVGEPT